MILDALKAGLAAFAAYKLISPDEVLIVGDKIIPLNVVGSLIAGTCGVLGHNFPIWLKFKGGKGVASAFGFILLTQPYVALIAFVIWLVMAVLFRYSSLAALTAAAAMPLIAYLMCPPIYAVFYSALALLVIIRHHANITRLLKGEESKISFKKK